MINIIGGAGFIGTSVCKILRSKKISFSIIDIKQSLPFLSYTNYADVRSLDSLENVIHEGSVIINLAAEHRDDVTPKSLYKEVNVDGAKNICSIARKKNISKIIFTSSVAVYGFAPLGTDESGKINPFNDYGLTKWQAEQVYKEWQSEEPEKRTLVIVRPTVVFGERNRGNVYNLLKLIASGKFIMVGDGLNRKSMAYVDNVAAFLEYSISFKSGVHIFNYIDKPDFSMNQLVRIVNNILGRTSKFKFKLPYSIGVTIGKFFDLLAILSGRKFSISSIRVKKFCANSLYDSAISKSGFVPPVSLISAIRNTVYYEFVEKHNHENVFYSE